MRKSTKKFIATLLLVTFVWMAIPSPASAGAWGEALKAAFWKQMMEQMVKKTQDKLVAALRMMAIKMIQTQFGQMLGKKAGGKKAPGTNGMVISDWRQFIYGAAVQYANKATTDFFKSMQKGTPAPLAQRIIAPAQKAVMTDPTKIKPDLQKYVREGRANMIFQPGWAKNPWLAWQMAAMPQNSLEGMIARGQYVQNLAFQTEAEKKKAEGIAGGGYQGKQGQATKGKPGQAGKATPAGITTPGSTIKDTTTKVQGMPIDMISMSRNIPDVVAGMVTQMIMKMLQMGLVKMTSLGGQKSGAMGGPAWLVGGSSATKQGSGMGSLFGGSSSLIK